MHRWLDPWVCIWGSDGPVRIVWLVVPRSLPGLPHLARPALRSNGFRLRSRWFLRFESSAAGHRQGAALPRSWRLGGWPSPLTPQHPPQGTQLRWRGRGSPCSVAGRGGSCSLAGRAAGVVRGHRRGVSKLPRRPPPQEPAASTRRKVTLLSLKRGIEQPELTVRRGGRFLAKTGVGWGRVGARARGDNTTLLSRRWGDWVEELREERLCPLNSYFSRVVEHQLVSHRH